MEVVGIDFDCALFFFLMPGFYGQFPVSFLVYLPISSIPFHFATLVEFACHRWPCQIFGKFWLLEWV